MYAILSKRCFKPFFRSGIRSVRRVQLKTDGVLCDISCIIRTVGVNVIKINDKGSLGRFYKNCLCVSDVLYKARRL